MLLLLADGLFGKARMSADESEESDDLYSSCRVALWVPQRLGCSEIMIPSLDMARGMKILGR